MPSALPGTVVLVVLTVMAAGYVVLAALVAGRRGASSAGRHRFDEPLTSSARNRR
ncbi:hypothetical protein [Streptomyces sp. NPDC029526]|uniref:hypothetical protein n=1 Tax=Streptomyces sp. NPDC029526 TaxID=3155728 RepID=UPI0033CA7164